MRSELLRPETVLASSPEEADALLDRLEREVPVRPGVAELPTRAGGEAVVFGDSHGDWRTMLEVRRGFLSGDAEHRCLVGLGDYVDRAPNDCGPGSVVNALLLLDLVAQFPDRVVLLQGNHETVSRIPVLPRSLPEEVDELWGPEAERLTRLTALLERGPLAAVSSNGAYLAHAGFPRRNRPTAWRRLLEEPDEETLIDIVWVECDAARSRRGVGPPWTEPELVDFLRAAGASIFLRGHDPEIMGRPLYGGRCLTLHTTRVYERYGGVLLGRFPLDRPVRSVADVVVEHLPTEGHSYPSVD